MKAWPSCSLGSRRVPLHLKAAGKHYVLLSRVKRSSACSSSLSSISSSNRCMGGRRYLEPMQLFTEEYALPLREEVVIRKTWLLRKFSPCSLRDCRDTVLICSYSCMDRSKILFLFPQHSRKMDVHIFSLPWCFSWMMCEIVMNVLQSLSIILGIPTGTIE